MTGERRTQTQFALLGPTRAELGESPAWSARDRCVWWVDIDGCTLFRTTLEGTTRSWATPEPPGFVQLDDGFCPIVGMQSGLFRFDPDTGGFDRLVAQQQPDMRFNDSCIDSYGRLWAGTMDMRSARPRGTLYLIGPDRRLYPVLEGFRYINGLAWDAVRERLFLSDSHPDVRTVWTLDCPGGRPDPASRRVFTRFDGRAGRPDGAALDADGDYWIAGVGGGALHRFGPDGTARACYAVPPEYPTKPAFAGDALSQLVLTCKNGALTIWDIGAELGVTGSPVSRWTDGSKMREDPTE
ncbi:SMP-30/gluconolactonase/LRE family protein [Seohaeicola saemankumensis]|nr:SMP-30/gluconolactonase/LRE family protein [Seohaeicola saemankumensis]MCA0869422.1 SMP-30/gluconolactonase/LRE family protein [Seohaeicola saemankumensis]